MLVSADPGHKHVVTPAAVRLRLARAAFPDDDVVLDDHARTVDTLRAHPEWRDPVFLIGADQFCDFLAWKEPNEVLALTRLAVATRPGFPRERLERVLAELEAPDRVLVLRDRAARPCLAGAPRPPRRGDGAGDDVPPAVAELIEADGLYGR